MFSLEVSNPVSVPALPRLKNAPRLPDLNGKPICEVWNGPHWRTKETFPYIEELLKMRFPNIKFIPYSEFPPYEEPDTSVTLYGKPEEITPVIKEKGCDAVILGNGA